MIKNKVIGCLFILAFLAVGLMPANAKSISVVDDSIDRLEDIISDDEFADFWSKIRDVDDISEIDAKFREAIPASSEVFDWYNTFNFNNSAIFFGEETIMTGEEVGDNMRNVVFQMLYGDIETACEMSILDVILLRALDSLILQALDIDFMGFCSGMSQAARDYYLYPEKIPLGRDRAYDLPPPDPNVTKAYETGGDAVETAIKEYVLWKGSAAFFNPNHLMNWVKMYLGTPPAAGGTNNALEFDTLAQLMNKDSPSYRPVVILLTAPFWEEIAPTKSHFVLAYDYEIESDGTKKIYIYDNRFTWREAFFQYIDYIELDESYEFKGTHVDPGAIWTRLCVYPETVEYNTLVRLLVDLLNQLASIVISCPVEVHITDPLGRIVGPDANGVSQIEFPAIYVEEGDQKIIVFPHGSGIPFNLNITGTDVGDYSIEMSRVINGKLVTEYVNGTTQAGESDFFEIALGDYGVDVERLGVFLDTPQLIAEDAVRLSWSRWMEPEFDCYEIYMSKAIDQIGELIHREYDQATTAFSLYGLEANTTHYFTVRVVGSNQGNLDSDQVALDTPVRAFDFTWYIISGCFSIAIVALIVGFYKRRTK
jgi:hypothetical protein